MIPNPGFIYSQFLTPSIPGMKSSKNHSSDQEVIQYTQTIMSQARHEMPAQKQFDDIHLNTGYTDEHHSILRRHSFDDNGGAYAGL